ncbi:hypothetical protein JL721_5882 [Aureococcus anophagefferens]|nr:hypothetical protein JL721_5882 [Aureococcus anophagefferens]
MSAGDNSFELSSDEEDDILGTLRQQTAESRSSGGRSSTSYDPYGADTNSSSSAAFGRAPGTTSTSGDFGAMRDAFREAGLEDAAAPAPGASADDSLVVDFGAGLPPPGQSLEQADRDDGVVVASRDGLDRTAEVESASSRTCAGPSTASSRRATCGRFAGASGARRTRSALEAREPPPRLTKPRTSVEVAKVELEARCGALEKELDAQRDEHELRVRSLRQEFEKLRAAHDRKLLEVKADQLRRSRDVGASRETARSTDVAWRGSGRSEDQAKARDLREARDRVAYLEMALGDVTSRLGAAEKRLADGAGPRRCAGRRPCAVRATASVDSVPPPSAPPPPSPSRGDAPMTADALRIRSSSPAAFELDGLLDALKAEIANTAAGNTTKHDKTAQASRAYAKETAE